MDCLARAFDASPTPSADLGTGLGPKVLIESKLSFSLFILLDDKGTFWDFMILFSFFSFGPKLGKRISMLSSTCRDNGLAHQDSWRTEYSSAGHNALELLQDVASG